MRRYIDADKQKNLIDNCADLGGKFGEIITLIKGYSKDMVDATPTADVVEVDKAQKEIDYWHDKAQSYEQTILKLSLNKADVVEVVRCKDCKHFDKYIDCKEMYQWDGFCDDWARKTYENWYCSRAERRNDGGE